MQRNWNIHNYWQLWKFCQFLKRLNIDLPCMYPAIYMPRYIVKRNEITSPHKNAHTLFSNRQKRMIQHSSTIEQINKTHIQ